MRVLLASLLIFVDLTGCEVRICNNVESATFCRARAQQRTLK